MIRKLAAAICVSILLGLFTAEAATNRGVHYDDTKTVGNEKLTLYGIGLLKWKYLVNVYLVGLYKPVEVPVDQVLLHVPKCLDFYFFVDMKASDFQDTGLQLMAKNVGEKKGRKPDTGTEKIQQPVP